MGNDDYEVTMEEDERLQRIERASVGFYGDDFTSMHVAEEVTLNDVMKSPR